MLRPLATEDSLSELLADARALLRDRAVRVLEEQFREIEAQALEQWKLAREQAWSAGRRSITEEFSRTARCLSNAENQEQWTNALMDEARRFAQRVALFAAEGDSLVFRAQRGFDSAPAEPVPLREAAALANAVESMDTVVAMRTAREVSPAILEMSGAAGPRKIYAVPLAGKSRALAVLYAEGGERAVDLSALELLSGLAAASLEVRRPRAEGLVEIAAAATPQQRPMIPLPEAHLRAQRFARVQAAVMQLYRSQSLQAGRASRDVYGALREEIDRSREEYHEKFLSQPDLNVDYLHQELLHTLANDDIQMLGPEYPGPMV
jgi:hypothetical protein